MPIGDYQVCMLPFLEILSDGADHRLRDIVSRIADKLNLSDDERSTLLPSGQQTVIQNRVGWARTHLKKAGLVESPARGIARITDEGRTVLAENPARIDNKFLRRYPSFCEFVDGTATEDPVVITPDGTPEERLQAAYDEIRHALADELLDRIKACSPQFFERLAVDLLVKMGYGGSRVDAGQAIGRSGDGGIDGMIKEDKLGLDAVYIQAKRWDRTVGRPEVQAFAGSMEGFRARKGVFNTTSSFSREAEDYVTRTERRIVLVDGRKLTELMIEHGVGVSTSRSYDLKRMDHDYFEEEA